MIRYTPLAIALSLGLLVTGCSTTSTSELSPRREPVVVNAPALMVNPSQPGVDQIVIDRVDLMRPGFVVIRADDNGRPGDVISHSVMLTAGRHEGIGVNIDPARSGSQVIAVVHADDGNVLFEFPGPDGPIERDGQMLMSVIKLR